MAFTKATKKQAKGRVAFVGVTGSGKTWTGLMWAKVLAGPHGRIALIDTENASASKYADTYDFDTMVLTSFQPKSYIAAIHEAEAAGYDVLVIDSLSHAWTGKDGVLAMVDNATSRARSGNAFTTGWREVTPEHNSLVDALVQCKCHLIVTMRAKTEYVIEDVNGKKIPRKIGMAPVQRDGMEYEFDLVADMDANHQLLVTKSRCRPLDKFVALEPGPDVAEKFRKWLVEGEAPAAPPQLSSREQVREIKDLLSVVRIPEGVVDKWFAKAGVEEWDDMPADTIAKCIEYMKSRLPATGDNAATTIPGADMTTEEVKQYQDRIDKAFQAQKFSPDNADAIIGYVLKRSKLPNLKAGGKEWCEKLIEAINEGIYDNMKPVAAESAK